MTECNKALCEWYLTNHPAPSWRHIADGLYGDREHEVLEVLRDQVHYLKGLLLSQLPTLSVIRALLVSPQGA